MSAARAADFEHRPPEDEVVYFLLPDRFADGDPSNNTGGIGGGPERHGHDPRDKGFYLGGDLKGVARRLDYIQGLGATALWLAPVYRNKPVQGSSAGYHGYWITDFTDVDPHFGTRADFKALVDAAHARGMKVYLDIVINHTADVVKYRECHAGGVAQGGCAYRSQAEFPYSRRGGLDGPAINAGFKGLHDRAQENFARLTRPDHAYTPFVPAEEADAKRPAWLNDVGLYHNRGDSDWRGESALLGDFAGLDDLMTEHPRVVQGFIDVYKQWITDFGIDGYRIDTVRHVEPAFWRAFVPAILEHARANGRPNFHIFGEVYEYEPGQLARWTREAAMPSVLDFGFQGAVRDVLGRGAGSDALSKLYDADTVYEGGAGAARRLPTFVGNHDMGRLAFLIRRENRAMTDEELLRRVRLGHALMMFGRGVPVIYSGDEQGFIGDGDDKDSREPLFANRVPEYNDNRALGGTARGGDRYDTGHPLYRAFAEMARIRREHRALRRGEQRIRLSDDEPGLFVLSRIDPATSEEVLVAFNTSLVDRTAQTSAEAGSLRWRSIHGRCAERASAPGSVRVTVPALDYIVCRSGERS